MHHTFCARPAVEHVGRLYSNDLKSVCMYLLSKPTPAKTIDDVVAMLAPRLVLEVDTALLYVSAGRQACTGQP